MSLILASASPRRSELLGNAGISFTIEPAHVREEAAPGETPLLYAQRLARDKASAILQRHPVVSQHNPADSQHDAADAVLGADTVVVVDEHLLEKPLNAEDAVRMLSLLSGRTHQVITGVCLMTAGFERTEGEITQVSFSELSENEIAEYVRSGEPMDKAGAYGIQGMASRWVTGVEGCYFNVVGLPVGRVYRMIRAAEAATGRTML